MAGPFDDPAAIVGRIVSQLRSIDEIGWLDDRSIGVILPSSSIEGGKRYAQRVAEACRPDAEDLPFRAYAYPGHWPPAALAEGDADAPSAAWPPPNLPDAFCLRMPTWKRAMDIAGSVALLVLLWPFFLVVAAYIKAVSPGPAFFVQQRVGYGSRLFSFIKFRTMRRDNSVEAHKAHIVAAIRSNARLEKLDDKGDPRIIPGGKVLRRLCIDELPQLVNVLRGEMSLVGPRPCLPYEAEEFLRWNNQRFDVVPGMTGLWQVSGKNKLTFLQMIRLDISYANNISPWLDIKIILMTIPAILKMVFEAVAARIGTGAAAAEGDAGTVGAAGAEPFDK